MSFVRRPPSWAWEQLELGTGLVLDSCDEAGNSAEAGNVTPRLHSTGDSYLDHVLPGSTRRHWTSDAWSAAS